MFKTKCKIRGKCFSFIVDGVSTENLMSTKVIQKLNIKCMAHPNTYMVSQGYKTEIMSLCLSSVWYFPHTKFPWPSFIWCCANGYLSSFFLEGYVKLNKNVFHDGKKNTFLLEKVGRRFRLLPMSEGKGDNSNSNNVICYVQKWILKREEEGKMFFCNFLKDVKSELEKIDVLIKDKSY